MFASARSVPREVSNIYGYRYRQGAVDFCRDTDWEKDSVMISLAREESQVNVL